MRILVLGNASRPGVPEEAERLLPFLCQRCEVVAVDLEQRLDLTGLDADLTLVLGGDGAILRAARQMGYHQIPVLGVNLGKLGFLADLTPGELCAAFSQVCRGDYRITSHLMFECVYQAGGAEPRTFLGLNDAVIETGPPFHMVEYEVEAGGEALLRSSGDGLILSTPVGSTAHNLAAGGPVVGQELCAFAITPLCPHTLTTRPLVESADKVYTIRLVQGQNAWLVIDGQEQVPLTPADRVTVRRAPVAFRLVKVSGHSYYQTLRDKLRWGTAPVFRVEPPPAGRRKTTEAIPTFLSPPNSP